MRSETFSPARLGACSRRRRTRSGRDCVAARDRELVDVERERRAGAGRGGEVLEQRRVVELEVRRRDHRDRVGAGRGRVLGERDRVGGRLRAAVDGDLEPVPRGLDVELGDAPALGEREQDPLAVRPQREQPVEPAGGEEVDDRPDPVLVDCGAAVAERRDRGGESSRQHARDSIGRCRRSAGSRGRCPTSCRPIPTPASGTPRRGRRPRTPFRPGAASGRGTARSRGASSRLR